MSTLRPVVVCFGPGPAFKGGIANYNTSLALAMHAQGAKVHIVSWTQQYPAIIPRDFKDRASKNNLLEGTDIEVHYITNYNNPLSWKATVNLILSLQPQQVILQWALSIQGIPMGYIAKKLFKSQRTEVVFDCHLVVQKEGSALDALLTKRGLKYAHTYVTHAYKTVDELRHIFPTADFLVNETGNRAESKQQTVIKLYHPVYDLFKPQTNLNIQAAKDAMGLNQHVFLFFGFIRKYKGLHQAIEAFELLTKKRQDVSLLIVGESFWNTLPPKSLQAKLKKFLFGLAKKVFLKKEDDEKDYQPLDLIKEKGLEPFVFINNAFVPNEEVPLYFQVSDNILLFYLTATPSGVESLSYNFSLPVLASKVGHFPETIVDGYNGYLAEDRDIQDMANVMEKAITHPIPRRNIAESARHLSWENYASKILFKGSK